MVLYHTFFIANWLLQGFGWLLLRSHKCWSLSHIRLFVTPRTVTHQDPLPVEFSKQEYWSSLPCPPPGDLPDPGIKPDLLHCRQIPYHLSHLESQLKSHICMQTMNAVHLWFGKWSSIKIHSFPNKFIVIKSEMWSTIKLFYPTINYIYYLNILSVLALYMSKLHSSVNEVIDFVLNWIIVFKYWMNISLRFCAIHHVTAQTCRTSKFNLHFLHFPLLLSKIETVTVLDNLNNKSTLIYSTCWFPWYKYSHHD